jgi:6-phosphogluconolactonase
MMSQSIMRRWLPTLGLLAAACNASPSSVARTDAGHERDASPSRDSGSSRDATTEPEASHDAGAHEAGDAAAARVVAYASGYAPNIDLFTVDLTTGTLTDAGSIAAFGTSPSFLAVDPSVTHIYAVDENTPGQVGAYSIDPASGALTFLNAVSSGGDGPPFVSVEPTGKFVLVANYTSGSVSVLPIQSDGSLGTAVDTEMVGAEAHMILADPTSRFVFVPCKGADYVAQFLFDAKTGRLTPNATPYVDTAGDAGPRHIAFHPNGKFVYLINETNSTMSLYAFDSTAGTLSELQTLSTLPSSFTGTNTAAEVHVHPSGTWVLGSNRGYDSLVVFAADPSTGKLTVAGFTPSGGMTPRDFTLDSSGALVYAANETTGNVVPFHFDASKGSLTMVDASVPVTQVSFIGLVPLTGP